MLMIICVKNCALTRWQGWSSAGWSWCSWPPFLWRLGYRWNESSTSLGRHHANLQTNKCEWTTHARTKHTQTHISPSYAWSFFVPFFISCLPAWHKIWSCFVFQRRRLLHCSVVPLWYGKTVWRVTLLFRSNRNCYSLSYLLTLFRFYGLFSFKK